MLDFIMAPLIVGICCAGVYGLFELFVRRRERMMIIEKMGDKLDASAFEMKNFLPSYARRFVASFSSLKAGMLLTGIGLGLLVGFCIVNFGLVNNYSSMNEDWHFREMASVAYGASVLFFGGLFLVISFIIETIMTSQANKKAKMNE